MREPELWGCKTVLRALILPRAPRPNRPSQGIVLMQYNYTALYGGCRFFESGKSTNLIQGRTRNLRKKQRANSHAARNARPSEKGEIVAGDGYHPFYTMYLRNNQHLSLRFDKADHEIVIMTILSPRPQKPFEITRNKIRLLIRYCFLY
ncbi:hypothetical protein TNCV_1642631 [Trichonephila clavipes]|nr:hypothetical protein TNCV_1642631 [Trichonephila clavipes]